MTKKCSWAVALALGCTAGACTPYKTKLAAEGTGDLSYAPALRIAPDLETNELCGAGDVVGARLGRHPYVECVTESSARVSFTALDAEPNTAELWRPGEPERRTLEVPAPERSGEPASLLLSGLEPSTLYCYQLNGLTGAGGFRTAPSVGSGRVRFVAFGDSGDGSSNQRAVFSQVQSVPYDLTLHLGDLAYEHGEAHELEARYFGVYQRMTRSFPVFPVIGNHDNAAGEAAPYLSAFNLPDNGTPEQRERYYSFDYGPVHFAALDTERVSAAQAEWLDRDLRATQQPWLIVFGHHPPWSSGRHHSNLAVRDTFGQVLKKHRVPLVLSGHEHDYERTLPIEGTTYIVSGGGGRETRFVGVSAFTAYAEDVLHFVYAEVEGDFLTLHAIDGVGREFDSARIRRPGS